MDAWTWRDDLLAELSLTGGATAQRSLRDARGAVLAADVRAPESIPALPVSAMDGFAVRWADISAPGAASLPVALEIPAGPVPAATLPEGTAARIMTGAPVPRGADTVVPVELTDAAQTGPAPSHLRLREGAVEALERGRHVRGVGEEVERGQVIARAGTTVSAGLVGLAASLGIAQLTVREPWRVTVVVTGDELRPCAEAGGGEAPAAEAPTGAVRESNGVMLAAQLDAFGCAARVLRSGDDPAMLQAVLADAAAGSDLVITTGGVGHGAYDVVKSALQSTSRFAHLDMKPGGPQGYGRLPGGIPAIHLPGTPVGALVGFHLFARPLLQGEIRSRRLPLLSAEEPRGRRAALHVHPGRLVDGGVRQVPGTRLLPYGEADALILLGAGDAVGAMVDVVDLHP